MPSGAALALAAGPSQSAYRSSSPLDGSVSLPLAPELPPLAPSPAVPPDPVSLPPMPLAPAPVGLGAPPKPPFSSAAAPPPPGTLAAAPAAERSSEADRTASDAAADDGFAKDGSVEDGSGEDGPRAVSHASSSPSITTSCKPLRAVSIIESDSLRNIPFQILSGIERLRQPHRAERERLRRRGDPLRTSATTRHDGAGAMVILVSSGKASEIAVLHAEAERRHPLASRPATGLVERRWHDRCLTGCSLQKRGRDW